MSSTANYCKYKLEELWISTQTLSEPLPSNSSLDSQLTELPDFILRLKYHFFTSIFAKPGLLTQCNTWFCSVFPSNTYIHWDVITFSAVSVGRVGYVIFSYCFANYNYYYCAALMPLISRISPQQYWSQLQLPILSLTQKTLHVFVFWLFFSVYKKHFWFTLTGKSSAWKVLHISSINNVFYYPTASLHCKGNHYLAPLLIYYTTRFILPIHYQSFKSSLAAALLHFQGGNRFSSEFRGKERHWALLRKLFSL